MLYFFRLLLLLINIDQETVLKWFGVRNINHGSQFSGDNVNILVNKTDLSSFISIKTLKLILMEIWQRVQDGLTLADIENILFLFFLSALLF